MSNFASGNSYTGFGGQGSSTPILKSTGTTTPAPTSRVLRWKDLESAAESAGGPSRETDKLSTRSLFGSEGDELDVLNGGGVWEDERHEFEELFI